MLSGCLPDAKATIKHSCAKVLPKLLDTIHLLLVHLPHPLTYTDENPALGLLMASSISVNVIFSFTCSSDDIFSIGASANSLAFNTAFCLMLGYAFSHQPSLAPLQSY